MLVVRRSFLLALLVCIGCSAQSSQPVATDADLAQRIEKQVRTEYKVPGEIKIEVGPRKPGEMGSYDTIEVTLSQGEEKAAHEFLISKDGNTLARLTKWDISAMKFAAEEAAAERNRAETLETINIANRPYKGNKDAKVTIVNYDDFQCPFCARMHTTLMNDVLKTYGDKVKIIYRDYPLTEIHPWATRAAVNANCLGELKNEAYWAYADYVHENQKVIGAGGRGAVEAQKSRLDGIARQIGQEQQVDMDKLNACMAKDDVAAVQAAMNEGNQVGVESTPTLYVNGEKVNPAGAVPFSHLKTYIDKALVAAGVPLPQGDAVAEKTEEKPVPAKNN